MSYVNVSSFHKESPENKVNPTLVDQQENPGKEIVPEAKTNGDQIIEAKSGKEKNLGQSNPPPISKKPKKLTKSKTSSYEQNDNKPKANTLNVPKHGGRSSLMQKAKHRLSKTLGSSNNHKPDTNQDINKDPMLDKRTDSSQSHSQTITPEIGDSKAQISEPIEYQNLLPSTSAKTTDNDKNLVKVEEVNSNASRESVGVNEKENSASKTKQAPATKGQNRKSGSGLRGMLDLSELKSKLKRPH
ncbi:hypothetical protein EGW08_014279 [Elysia chlorotica]|uniref:Uncharacterized protein n=1 Tax=Elysia chlorotica TaxID=188477 RepID=A0A3S1BY64_ELYCH|nr:hypothetical protein EGW08_014279 [Elysia chlorotica]